MPAKPYEILKLNGQDVPWYMLPFDRDGACTAPETRKALLAELAAKQFTDVYLFSHGWNNDWDAARERYDDFVYAYAGMRAQHGLKYPSRYKPLLVGVFWPSTALVLPWESAPKFAAAGAGADEAEQERDLVELSTAVPEPQRARLIELLQKKEPQSPQEREELAAILLPLWNRFQADDSTISDLKLDPLTASELSALWSTPSAPPADEDEFGGLAGAATAPGTAPQAAFSLGSLLSAPRDLLRMFTVLQMKDRAARVGGSGVSQLLRELLAQEVQPSGTPLPRVHLIGHSYGCVVLMSALCAIPKAALRRKVDSALLLQGAVSRFCFAERVPGKSYPGGYRVAFERLVQPILATFSKRDAPLTQVFHLAVRRDSDLGQPRIAGAPPAPSKYAALGGYGPDGCREGEYAFQVIRAVGSDYQLESSAMRIIGLRADEAIPSHGDISVPETWWALYNQVRTSAGPAS